MLGSPVGGAPSLGASGRLNVFMGTEDFGLQGSGQPVEFSAPPVALVGGGKDGVAPGSSGELAVGLGDIGYKEAGDQKRDAAAGASSGASSTSGGLVGGMAALEYYPPSYASSVSGGTGKAAGNGGGGGADAAGARPDPGRADAGVAALSDGEHALDGEEATDGEFPPPESMRDALRLPLFLWLLCGRWSVDGSGLPTKFTAEMFACVRFMRPCSSWYPASFSTVMLKYET